MGKGEKKVWLVFGTRPEAIKMAPVYRALAEAEGTSPVICVTAQHREMLDHVLGVFNLEPDFDLDLMEEGQSPWGIGGRALSELGDLFSENRPDMVLVQGDTTTTFAASLAAFYNRVPVGHVEAGLRTGRLDSPFPEEANRILTTRLAALHFAPTSRAADALLAEGVPESSVSVTGNTVIDALQVALDIPLPGTTPWQEVKESRKLILVTTHRRESFGPAMEGVFRAIRRIASREDVQIVIPLHPNPNVRRAAGKLLEGVARVSLVEPMEYLPFVHLMSKAHLILTDSGGIQEEAPSLGVPVLVLRDVTERPEASEAGVAILVGTDEEKIYGETCSLLDDSKRYQRIARVENPYGDGCAGGRIARNIEAYYKGQDEHDVCS